MRLPTDILHLILSYLSHNHYAGILKFRTICKEWKEVGDVSPLWLSCELHITAPRAYCERIHTFLAISVKIKLSDEINYLPKMINKYIINIEKISSSSNEKSRRLRAFEVSSTFLQKYRLCHRAWDRFLSYHSFLQFFHRWEKEYFQMAKKYNLTYILIALLILSAWLISTLPNNPTSLKWNEILAFVIILLESMVHLFHEVLLSFASIFSRLTWADNLNILLPSTLFPYSHSDIIPLVFEASLISSLVLLICKFSSDNPSFKYSYIVLLPFIVITLCLIVLIVTGLRYNFEAILIASFYFCFCLPCLLIALYYDEPNNVGISSLGYTLLPLIPIDIMIFALSITFIIDSFQLFRDYFLGKIVLAVEGEHRNYYGLPRIIIRFYFNLMKTISMINVLGVLIYLHYSSFEGSLDLSTSFILVTVLIISLSISVTCSEVDNPHLSY